MSVKDTSIHEQSRLARKCTAPGWQVYGSRLTRVPPVPHLFQSQTGQGGQCPCLRLPIELSFLHAQDQQSLHIQLDFCGNRVFVIAES